MDTFTFTQGKWEIKRMNKNSFTVENLRSHEQAYISRRVFNTIVNDPNNMCTLVEREYMGIKTMWIATMLTFLTALESITSVLMRLGRNTVE